MFGLFRNSPQQYVPHIPGHSLPPLSSLPPTPSPLAAPAQPVDPTSPQSQPFRSSVAPSMIYNPTLSLEERLTRSSEKTSPIALREIFNELEEVHAGVVISFASIGDDLMNFHGWEIRQHDPGFALTHLVEQFLQLTRCMSYMKISSVTNSAAILAKGMVANKNDQKRVEESRVYFKLRLELTEKMEKAKHLAWEYLKTSDEALGMIHFGLTDGNTQSPLLIQVKEQSEAIYTVLTAFSRIWLKEAPQFWDATVRSSDMLALRRFEMAWSTLGNEMETSEQKMRREVSDLMQRMQKRNWIGRDDMARRLRLLWEEFDYVNVN